jgi:hypothetical protein
MVFTVLGAVAELERSLVAERVRADLLNARAKGKSAWDVLGSMLMAQGLAIYVPKADRGPRLRPKWALERGRPGLRHPLIL